MTLTRATHAIDVAAPAQVVWRIVSDVSQWPLCFRPTVHAERLSGDDSAEVIRICAVANGDLKVWESRRRLDPDARVVEFEQVRSPHPVAVMGGAWRVEDGAAGTCRLVLDHHYRAVDDDPVSLARITAAVDSNSTSELAGVKRAAELGAGNDELLLEFEDSDEMAGSTQDAYDFLYDLSAWARRLPHVLRMKFTEDTRGLQHMEMDTRSPDGSVHTTVSGRFCTAPNRIVYKQTKVAGVLQAHAGSWTFEPLDGGRVRITSRHWVVLDPDAISRLPHPPASLAEARKAVRNALGANSRATIAAAKEYLIGKEQ